MNNEKIVLNRIAVKNWMGINNIVKLNRNVTWLSGDNGCGKSSFVDAMSTVLFGATDRDFNKASDSKGNVRTMRNAIHNKLKSGECTRNCSVISWVILEFYDEERKNYFLNGMYVSSKSPNATSDLPVKYFKGTEMTLDDLNMEHLLETNDPDECDILGRKKNPKIQVLSGAKRNAFEAFFGNRNMRTGNFEEYKRQMNRVLTAKLGTDDKPITPDEFVKSYIFPDSAKENAAKVLQDIRESQNDLNEKRMYLEKLNQKMEILKDLEKDLSRWLVLNDEGQKLLVSTDVLELDSYEQKLSTLKEDSERYKNQYSELNEKAKKYQAKLEEISDEIEELNKNIATDKTQEIVEDLRDKKMGLLRTIENLKRQEEQVNFAVKTLKQINDDFELGILIDEEDIKDTIVTCKERIEVVSENVNSSIFECQQKLKSLEKNKQKLTEEIEKLKSGIITDQKVLQYNKFKNELNKIFETKGIRDKAYLLYEAIDSIDPEWQKAIEGFLGGNRFLLIVKPENLTCALNAAKGSGVSIAKIKYEEVKRSDNAAAKVNIKSGCDLAQIVVNNLLSGVHLCETVEELKDSKYGIMKDGRTSLPGKYNTTNISKINLYCGAEALKKEIEKKTEELKENSEEIVSTTNFERELLSKKTTIRGKRDQLFRFDTLNFDIESELKNKETEFKNIENELSDILNSPECERSKVLIDKLDKLKIEKKKLESEKETLSQKMGGFLEKQKSADAEAIILTSKIKQRLKDLYAKGYKEKDVSEIKEYIETKNFESAADIMKLTAEVHSKQKAVEKRIDKRNDEYIRNHEQNFVLSYKKECLNVLRNEIQKYENIEIGKAQEAIDACDSKLSSCKDGFFDALYTDFQKTRREMNRFNKVLADVKFQNDVISIEVEGTNNKKFREIYEQIMTYCSDASTPEEKKNADIELSNLFLKIKDCKSDEFDSYADYKNYLSAKIMLHSDIPGTRPRSLADDMQSSSGGQKQTPYFVLLAMSLITSYKENGFRMIMLDEAFFKMDLHRVKAVLKFYEELNLQVILSSFRTDLQSVVNIIHSFSRNELTGNMTIVSTAYNWETDEVEEYKD